MPDWSAAMEQTFEYYIVDPGTWKDKELLMNVKSSTINRDSDTETLGSANIETTDTVNECYIRVYLITLQNGIKEKFPLGTFLIQTPSYGHNGKLKSVSMTGYTSLIELKEKQPPLGYYIPEKDKIDGEEVEVNVMDRAYSLTKDNVRAPVIKTENEAINTFPFVADPNDSWLSYLSDFIANQFYVLETYEDGTLKRGKTYKYKFDVDEMGCILFAPEQDTASLQPVWTYTDDNSSILYSDFTMDYDLYGIPNAVEVIYSSGEKQYYAKCVNDREDSPVSTKSRGREILLRVTDPDIVGNPTKDQIEEYADQLLESASSIQYTITYTHGYCPVRVGDCVRINNKRAGINNVKAKVISQSIKCETGCPVTEKAVFTTNLWR